MTATLSAECPGLSRVHRGKVRDTFDLGEAYLLVATDRVSAFDIVMADGVPDKGRILNHMSAFWFDRLADVCPNHLLSVDDETLRRKVAGWHDGLRGRSALVRKARPLPIECVVRGYVAGSLLRELREAGSEGLGLGLRAGLREGDRLPEPIFTPATKATEGHDENISFDRAVSLVGAEVAEQVKAWSLELYRRAAAHAESVGLILADTKFEFGEGVDGLLWIDEALTPDSSRYWEAARWQPGGPQTSFDKQPLRDYLEASGWDKRPPGPRLPDDVVHALRARYLEAFRRVTGRDLPL